MVVAPANAGPALKQHWFNASCLLGAYIISVCYCPENTNHLYNIYSLQCRPNVFDFVPTLYKCYTNVLCLLGGYRRVCALALVLFDSKQNLLTRCHSDTAQHAASSVNRANLLGVKNSCISDQGPCTLWLC